MLYKYEIKQLKTQVGKIIDIMHICPCNSPATVGTIIIPILQTRKLRPRAPLNTVQTGGRAGNQTPQADSDLLNHCVISMFNSREPDAALKNNIQE